MRNLSARETLLIIIAAIAIVGFAYYKLFYTPTINDIMQLEASIAEAESQAAVRTQTEQALPQLTEQLNVQTEQRELLLSEMLASELDAGLLTEELQRIVDQNGGSEKSISFLPEQLRYLSNENADLGFYYVLQTEISFSANSDALLAILKGFEQSSMPSTVQSLSVSKQDTADIITEDGTAIPDPSQQQLSVFISLEFYAQQVNHSEPLNLTYDAAYNYGSGSVFE